ncbi:hypothetical protein BD779DRAFT_1547198 [Infundibulicybe gibba]|nr:hypothetical protein BD779DRAFT_1547198 [Infundibulicybe gibba]
MAFMSPAPKSTAETSLNIVTPLSAYAAVTHASNMLNRSHESTSPNLRVTRRRTTESSPTSAQSLSASRLGTSLSAAGRFAVVHLISRWRIVSDKGRWNIDSTRGTRRGAEAVEVREAERLDKCERTEARLGEWRHGRLKSAGSILMCMNESVTRRAPRHFLNVVAYGRRGIMMPVLLFAGVDPIDRFRREYNEPEGEQPIDSLGYATLYGEDNDLRNVSGGRVAVN